MVYAPPYAVFMDPGRMSVSGPLIITRDCDLSGLLSMKGVSMPHHELLRNAAILHLHLHQVQSVFQQGRVQKEAVGAGR